ncbi:MAG: hypothetical protein ACRC1K_08975 [Planctomycetia bacterium]
MAETKTVDLSPDAVRNGQVLSAYIESAWRGKEADLASRAKCSANSLSLLKRGFDRKTRVLKDVCAVLSIDAEAILEGEIKPVNFGDRNDSTDIIELARTLVGTEHEPAARAILQHLSKLSANEQAGS